MKKLLSYKQKLTCVIFRRTQYLDNKHKEATNYLSIHKKWAVVQSCANDGYIPHDKYEKELVSQVAEHYQVSLAEATDYVDLMSKDSCSFLLQRYGYQPNEIKKLVKGVK